MLVKRLNRDPCLYRGCLLLCDLFTVRGGSAATRHPESCTRDESSDRRGFERGIVWVDIRWGVLVDAESITVENMPLRERERFIILDMFGLLGRNDERKFESMYICLFMYLKKSIEFIGLIQ